MCEYTDSLQLVCSNKIVRVRCECFDCVFQSYCMYFCFRCNFVNPNEASAIYSYEVIHLKIGNQPQNHVVVFRQRLEVDERDTILFYFSHAVHLFNRIGKRY